MAAAAVERMFSSAGDILRDTHDSQQLRRVGVHAWQDGAAGFKEEEDQKKKRN